MSNLTEQTDPAAEITISSNGTISVLERTTIYRDGAQISVSNHRYPLSPGDDVDSKHPRIAAVAESVWTPDVKAAWKVAQADLAEAEAAPELSTR